MAPSTTYITLRALLAEGAWPEFLLDSQGGALLDRIAYEGGESVGTEDMWGMSVRLRVLDEIALPIPPLGGAALVAGSGPIVADIEGSGFFWNAQIYSELFKLRFPRWMLKPAIQDQNGTWVADGSELSFSEIELPLNFVAGSSGEVDLQWPGETTTPLSLPKSMIGDTGIMIEALDVLLRLNSQTPIPAAYDLLGLPDSWRGVLIEQATLTLPPDLDLPLTNQLTISNCAIGSGGFSGTLSAPLVPEIVGSLGGREFHVTQVDLSFAQNALLSTQLTGSLNLPFFDKLVDVLVSIGMNGEYLVRLSDTGGLHTLTKDDVLQFTIQSIGFRLKERRLTTFLSGELTPLFESPTLEWPTFEVRELAIDHEGNVSLEGGWLDLPTQYALNFYGFHVEITKLGFGKREDGGKWLGFSGGIKFVDDFSAGASVEGMRVIWYDDGSGRSPFVTLEGVGVELKVPGALSFKGFVSYRGLDGDVGHRFDGNVQLWLDPLDMGFDAQLVIGSRNGNKFYAVYLGVELPAGIPLAATGLGIYGFAGLYANQMKPGKRDDEEWYQGWYMREPVGVAELVKWDDQPGAMAFGAGVTIGTLPDNGYLFSGRMLFAISFPGPILLLEGKANLLAERSSLDEDAIFRCIGVIDPNEGSLLFGLDAKYKYNDSGTLIDIHGGAEAYFNWNTYDWHLYLGEDQPRERRISAEIFKLWQAESYFMLSPSWLKMGARLGWGDSWKFGPLRVTLEAWIEGNAQLSFKPAHFHGDVWVHGAAGLRAFGIGFSLTVDASIAADVFTPYHLLGKFKVKLKTPWPLPDPGATVTLEWPDNPGKDKPPLPLPLKEIAVEHFKVTTKWPLPRGNLLLPNYDGNGDGYRDGADPASSEPDLATLPIVPLDARPHLTFSRPVWDEAKVGVNVQDVQPERERIGNTENGQGPATIKYLLRDVALERRDGTSWTVVAEASGTGSEKLYGSWAPMPQLPDGGGDNPGQVKLWLWSKTPFEYTRNTGAHWGDWFAYQFGSYPCLPALPDTVTYCDFRVDFDVVNKPLASPWECPTHHVRLSWGDTLPIPMYDIASEGAFMTLKFPNNYTYYDQYLLITLPTPAKKAVLRMSQDEAFTLFWFNSAYEAQGPLAIPAEVGRTFVELEEDDIKAILIVYRHEFLYYGVEMTVANGNPAIRQELAAHIQQELVHWEQDGFVLEPYSTYRVKVVTAVDIKGEGPLSDYAEVKEQTEYGYFQTAGPPALATLSTPIGHPGEFSSGLDDLSAYVAQTIPLSVADQGKPPLTRPVYRAYDVGVLFNETYVDQMYQLDRRDLGLYLYDNNNRPVRDGRGRLISTSSHWDRAEEVTLSDSDQRWTDLLTTNGCYTLNLNTVARSKTLFSRVPYLLEPEAFYEARLVPLLLHEVFSGYAAGASASGSGATLGRWTVLDQGTSAGPSTWTVESYGSPTAYRVAQSSTIWGGSSDPNALNKPGTLLLYGDSANPAFPTADQPSTWDSVRLSAYISWSAGDGMLGVVFRYQNESTFYRYSMDRSSGRRRLTRLHNGSEVSLATDLSSFELTRDYLLTVEAIGPSIRVYQDGALVFDVADSTIASGRVGLYCWQGRGRFTGVRVDDFRPAARPGYRFKFTTSRYANFFHHLHSFPDVGWHAALTPAMIPDTTLTPLLGRAVSLATTPSSATEPTPEEAADYDMLAEALLGQSAWQQPPEVEVTRVERAGDTLGWLLRTPEPIGWSRATLTLSRATTTQTTAVPAQDSKITGVTLGATQANDETVSLVLHETVDLSGWRIEYRARTAGAAWAVFYTFGDEVTLQSGTRVRVYGGSATGAPAEAPSLEQRFAASGAVRLPSAGAELRLVGRDGRVRHARQFLPDASFSARSFTVLRKADGTGVFIRHASNAQGTYRLQLTYRRNNQTTDAQSLVFAEAGDDSEEQVTLDIPWPQGA